MAMDSRMARCGWRGNKFQWSCLNGYISAKLFGGFRRVEGD
jgi:hypothetical protein